MKVVKDRRWRIRRREEKRKEKREIIGKLTLEVQLGQNWKER